MAFATQQIQGHYLGIEADQSTTLHFKQHIGDLNLTANIVYLVAAIAGTLGITNLALTYGLSEITAVFLATLLCTGVIALRIKIFNRYAFAIRSIRISPHGDLEWLGGWLEHTAVGRIEVQHLDKPNDRYRLVCISQDGNTYILGSGLTQIRAGAICRDILFALRSSTLGKPIRDSKAVHASSVIQSGKAF